MLRVLLTPFISLPTYSCFLEANVRQSEDLKRMEIHCCISCAQVYLNNTFQLGASHIHPATCDTGTTYVHGTMQQVNCPRISAALAHILVINDGDKLVWLQRLLCSILFSQRVGSVILEVFSNLDDFIILCYHSLISHPEHPILTWPPYLAMFTFQGRSFHHLSRDGILLGSACHFCSFDKTTSDFLKNSTFPVIDQMLSYFFFEQTKQLTIEI